MPDSEHLLKCSAPTLSQYYQHFSCSFFCQYSFAKKLQITAQKTFVQKAALKMLVKLTPLANITNISCAAFFANTVSTENAVQNTFVQKSCQ